MNSYAQAETEDRRLVILRLLAKANGYSANEYVLQVALEGFAHSVSQDRLRSDIAWLAEQGLVRVDTLGGMQVVHVLARGVDVATGRATVPGVKRPRPE